MTPMAWFFGLAACVAAWNGMFWTPIALLFGMFVRIMAEDCVDCDWEEEL